MDIDLSSFDREVFEHLSPIEWKTCGELSEGIGTSRKLAGRRRIALWIMSLFDREFAEAVVLEANLGSLTISLSKFESAGWVESRWRNEPPEKTARRGGYRLREYRLTESGHRVRATLPREVTKESGRLVPQQT